MPPARRCSRFITARERAEEPAKGVAGVLPLRARVRRSASAIHFSSKLAIAKLLCSPQSSCVSRMLAANLLSSSQIVRLAEVRVAND
jgi:hypothetical protein